MTETTTTYQIVRKYPDGEYHTYSEHPGIEEAKEGLAKLFHGKPWYRADKASHSIGIIRVTTTTTTEEIE